ncbi:putative ATP-grasp superfamily ATP-dependent carboligase [Azospirillum fermentarium]|uniref:carboxylate--amine ligase n=1 Tax=Azospirillum fermentarium TaxID=1233114 RepID=UPI0022271528|nr:ATP-grasp domain-containing protein [Azospirillum fermentarium]MCW2248929.1 putative ATP-grasp superfamily ATP-dependent carboligase [Azospirillum fermentarium]
MTTVTTAPMACVLGDLDLVRPLGLAGVRCAVVAPPGAPVRHSRYTHAVIGEEVADTAPAALLARLLDFARSQPAPPVLFYQDDAQLLLVSRRREALQPAFRMVIAGAELVEDLVDKARFQALAERLGLPVPPTRRLDPTQETPPRLDLRYPVIVKPLTRTGPWDAVEGVGKAIPVRSQDELDALWPRLQALGIPVLAQEMIPGPESAIESYHVYVDGRGGIAGDFTGAKIRTYPLDYGHSTALTITDAPDVLGLGRRLVETLGLTGTAKFDFKRGPDGRLHLLEVNPRFTLWHHLGARAGVNLPALIWADLTGRRRPAAGRARAGATWCHVTKDRLAARESSVPLAAWLAWVAACDAKAAALHDPLPFLQSFGGRALARLSRRPAPVPAKG